jgi:hypothetical protein
MRIWSWVGRCVVVGLLLLVSLWVAGVLHFHLPSPWSWLALSAWAVLSGWLAIGLCRPDARGLRVPAALYLGVLLLVGGGWSAIVPLQDRPWADDVARRLRVESFDGRHVVLDNVRNFRWRSETDYDVVWERRQYDLDQLRSADVLLSYWMGPLIAHTLVSFGFADGRQLVFSLEIRKEQGESFDSLAGFFRRYEVTMVAADERDIVAVRTNARGEDVYLYRVSALKGAALRKLFTAYLQRARALDRAPAFYNTLTSNCTTIIWELAHQVSPALPLDWRLLASGYFARYVHEQGALAPGYDYRQLETAGRITERARSGGQDAGFSSRIRAGVPGITEGAVQ